MCGIAGFFDKSHTGSSPAGATLLRMLTALSCRGPDSAGHRPLGRRATTGSSCA